MQRTNGSGRLSAWQLQYLRKIAAAGKKHPDKRKYYIFLLIAILLCFYFLSFCKKHATALTIVLCSCMFVTLLYYAYMPEEEADISDGDLQMLAWQQEQLGDLRDKVYGMSVPDERESAFVRALMEENADTVGWLTIPGTKIDYPVMQTPEEEDYYLYRDFYGNKNQNGSLLLAAGCDASNENANWIIHGHNMKSGAMFGSLLEYRKKSYMKEHNLIFLDTLDGRRTYEVVSVFESQVYYEDDHVFKYYQCYSIEDWAEYDSFHANIKKLSLYDTGVDTVYGDHFLTLSTCDYYMENGRLVVVAKEIY